MLRIVGHSFFCRPLEGTVVMRTGNADEEDRYPKSGQWFICLPLGLGQKAGQSDLEKKPGSGPSGIYRKKLVNIDMMIVVRQI